MTYQTLFVISSRQQRCPLVALKLCQAKNSTTFKEIPVWFVLNSKSPITWLQSLNINKPTRPRTKPQPEALRGRRTARHAIVTVEAS